MRVKVGDKVVFVGGQAVPQVTGGWCVGVVEKVSETSSGGVVMVVDCSQERHVVFERFVKVIDQCGEGRG